CARCASARRRRHERDFAALRAAEAGRAEVSREEFEPLLHSELGRLPERFRAPVVLCVRGRPDSRRHRWFGLISPKNQETRPAALAIAFVDLLGPCPTLCPWRHSRRPSPLENRRARLDSRRRVKLVQSRYSFISLTES